jgi:hypothetical protein
VLEIESSINASPFDFFNIKHPEIILFFEQATVPTKKKNAVLIVGENHVSYSGLENFDYLKLLLAICSELLFQPSHLLNSKSRDHSILSDPGLQKCTYYFSSLQPSVLIAVQGRSSDQSLPTSFLQNCKSKDYLRLWSWGNIDIHRR